MATMQTSGGPAAAAGTALLHLCTHTEWRAALTRGALAPGDAGFVHLSTPDQATLPANRLFTGRRDLVALAVDPAGLDVRFEPGLPSDPPGMRFPHAYGPVPAAAVVAVLPYRPGPDGRFGAPPMPPARRDTAARAAAAAPSLLRRVATAEVPVTGGVAVRTDPVPASYEHNQLVIDGATTVDTLVADADAALGAAGLRHRRALLTGAGAADLAAALGGRGWTAEELVVMAAPAGGAGTGRVRRVGAAELRPAWDAAWCADLPGLDDAALAQLSDRYRLEEEVVDLCRLAVLDDAGDGVAASCLLKIDGATAVLDAVRTDPAHRRRGHGDALVAEARALAGRAGCDLVVLDAAVGDWPRHWYARRGFVPVGTSWAAGRS